MTRRSLFSLALAVLPVMLAGCGAMMSGGTSLSRQVDYLRQDVEKLTQQQKKLAAQVSDLNQQLSRGAAKGEHEQPPPATESRPLVKKPPQGPEAAEGADLASDPAALYRKAFNLMENAKYDQAIRAFGFFIQQFPQSDLADNAQYWMGECLYAQKKYADARDTFKAVQDHFPFGNKVPDALYKQALCEGKLGHKQAETRLLKELVDDYPFSHAAALAKAALKPQP
ncbi:MAG: tol-pal system protein YbgF [Acidobacteriota bacterium]